MVSVSDCSDQRAREICQEMHENDPVCQTLKISLEEVRSGFARISMRLDESMLNAYGTGHGGYSFLLADTAFGFACNSRGEKSFGQSAQITYLTFGRPGELLTAVAEARKDYEVESRRDAAYAVALSRLQVVYQQRGIFP